MAARIKIAYLIDAIYNDRAGTEKQLMGILRRIDREQFDPRLVFLRSTPWLERQALPCPATVLGYEGFLKRSFPGAIRRLADLIDREGTQIVQTFFEDSVFVGLAGRALCRRRPVLLASRRDLGLGADQLWYHDLFRLLRPLVNRCFDGMAVNAEAIRAHLTEVEKFPGERIKVIPNGVDLPGPAGRPELYRRSPAGLRIVVTANLKPVKRLDLFLHALAGLAELCPQLDFQTYILGEGRLRSGLTRMSRELGIGNRVHFPGAREDVWDFLRYADIGVLCSDREGLSNAILEYMACGLPVIATAVGGNSEMVDAANGILVPAGDSHALADALARLALDPVLRRDLGRASLARIRERHLWDRVMPQWEGYYQSLVLADVRELTSGAREFQG